MKSLVLSLALLATPAIAAGPFTVQETGKSFYRLDDAVKSVNGGDGTILIQPGTYRDCAIVESGRMAFRAVQPGTVTFDGGICEGKAALVLRGRDHMVDGITFQNMHDADANGAGIRIERGGLTVMNSAFRNSEEGILSADDPAAMVRIDKSSFSGLGRCDRGLSCAHSLYVGHYGRLIVTHSRFERGRGGHYLKSRAALIEATDNSFDDSAGHLTNYMIDLCAGATGTVARNIFVQGKDKENHSALIVIAAEERTNPSAGLVIADNKASEAPNVEVPTVFVADFSHEPLKIGANLLGPRISRFETR